MSLTYLLDSNIERYYSAIRSEGVCNPRPGAKVEQFVDKASIGLQKPPGYKPG